MTMLTKAGLRWMEEHRKRAQLRRLLDHDDRMLEDIGLTRIEAEIALGLPMDQDAMKAAHAASRRSLSLDRRAVWQPTTSRSTPRARTPEVGTDLGRTSWLGRLWHGAIHQA
ncbi:MAG: DUF1127 domain-containing protein [Pseudomonadota bacterium]